MPRSEKSERVKKPEKDGRENKVGSEGRVKGVIYFKAVGRRKRAVAKVWLRTEASEVGPLVRVNGKDWESYFSENTLLAKRILRPLEVAGLLGKVSVSAKVSGGGKSGQVGAVELGIARSIVSLDPALKPLLRNEGLLTRDPREKERKKPGFLRARKKPQFSKR